MKNRQLCVFGEVLFDHFPDGRRILGGAPFNVAWHLQAFGKRPHFLSRVGDDAEGHDIRAAMRDWGMSEAGLQTDPTLPTGRVEVSFRDGEPSYDIVHPSAWDSMAAGSSQTDCGLLYHGSLGLRDKRSRRALAEFLEHRPETVFVDVNLRPPWWDRDRVLGMLEHADWVKLNAGEFALLQAGGGSGTESVAAFMARHELRGLLLTHGSRGAELFTDTDGHWDIAPEQDIEVVDTVGAGDAFASVMILGLLSGWDMEITLRRAQAFASGIVGNRGATVNDPAFYQAYIEHWNRGA